MTGDNKRVNSACPEYEVLLEDFLEGRIEAGAADRVGKHLEDCQACRDSLRAAAQSTILIEGIGESAAEPSLGFARRTMTAIQGLEKRFAEEKRFWRPLAVLAWRVAMAGMLSVLLLGAYAALPSFLPRQAIVVSQMTQQDIFLDPVQQPVDRDEALLMVTERNHEK